MPVAGAAMAEDLVGQMQAGHAFAANLAVFKTARQMSQTLLDLKA
jgi:flagellar hook protein FlgE